ncbi:hypothetical protein M9435_002793 [Picochlorum sp. BPE23]|nr:hypothetical protein M9435_002793 [Picochlorum sp. BPE23]
MSSIYNLEPPSVGKVVLKTSKGDLDIEFWPKEAPLAVRNFVQLCMEGYYDGTVFNRVVRNFLIQGGDPTGTGKGGESIYGRPFKDEFHSRLKFSHRGILACVNENRPDSNGSQFFITLDRAEHLNKTATIFGKVVGDTIHNLSRFNDIDTNEDDRPEDPVYIEKAILLTAPMEGIRPRAVKKAVVKQDAVVAVAKASRKTKNVSLISFDEDEFVDDIAVPIKKTKVEPVEQEKQAVVEEEQEEELVDYEEEEEDHHHHHQDGIAVAGNNNQEKEEHQEKGLKTERVAAAPDDDKEDKTRTKQNLVPGISRIDQHRQKYIATARGQKHKYGNKKKRENSVLDRIKHFAASLHQTAPDATNTQHEDSSERVITSRLDDLLQ